MEKEMATERLVLAKIATGDEQAFAILYKFYRNKVYGYALKILQSPPAAQEIVQEVFIKLWLKRAELAEIENFGGFLRIIVRNDTLNALKKIALQQRKYTLINQDQTEIDTVTDKSIAFNETKKLLDDAIESLPAQQKLVYSLCHLDGLKQKDVATQLGISPLTVKVHLREAVKSIRIYLNQHHEIKTLGLLLFFLK
ncbi:RNA polymerase sigma factor [Pedobacter sp.]|uniref:RNA polymerase sigma factor n=1 Tax=Pedobacter sp. TaxID=1411316 RepID=UPI003BA8C53F